MTDLRAVEGLDIPSEGRIAPHRSRKLQQHGLAEARTAPQMHEKRLQLQKRKQRPKLKK